MKSNPEIHWMASPDGSPNSAPVRFAERVEIDLREVHPDDAPIALEWAGGLEIIQRLSVQSENLYHAHSVKEYSDNVTRWFDGRHYAPYLCHFGKTASEIVEVLEEWPRDFLRVWDGFADFQTWSKMRRYDPAKYPGMDTSIRERALGRLDDAIKNCLVVDDILWIACPEPTVLLTEAGSKGIIVDLHREGVERTFSTLFDPDWDMDYSAVHRFDQVSELQNGAAGELEFTVHIPESLTIDCGALAVVNSFRRLTNAYAVQSRHLPTVPPAIMTSLAKAQACLWNRAISEIEVDALADSLLESAELCAALETDPLIVAAARDAHKCCTRWNDRPIQLEEQHSGLTLGVSR